MRETEEGGDKGRVRLTKRRERERERETEKRGREMKENRYNYILFIVSLSV